MVLDKRFGGIKTKMGIKNSKIKSKPKTFTTKCGEELTATNGKYAPALEKLHIMNCNICKSKIKPEPKTHITKCGEVWIAENGWFDPNQEISHIRNCNICRDIIDNE
jgi:hypothetical protein